MMVPPRPYRWTGAAFEARVLRRYVLAENPWKPCPTCHQQGREWAPFPDGYRSRTCITCLGVGQVPSW